MGGAIFVVKRVVTTRMCEAKSSSTKAAALQLLSRHVPGKRL